MLRRLVGGTALMALGASVAIQGAAAQERPSPPLALVLSRAATYVETFADRVSGFVTAETYVQDVMPAINRFGSRPGGTRPYTGAVHRELKSDLLLVRPIGADGWMQFRDVTEVDGKKLKDRNDRLARLFLEPSKSTAAQARKIMNESSRYNIGDIERNINLPVLALVVLDRNMQPGFEFTLEKPDTRHELPPSISAPDDAIVVAFRETQMRTMVASPQGKNMPASGRFWLDRSTAQVFLSEIGVEDLWLRALIHVRYGVTEGIDVPVPQAMHERYDNKLNGSRVEGLATYSDFRKFTVSVDEDIAPIGDTKKQER
jgi:hypothetical protein